MTANDLPTTYEEWVHCITVKCKIALTAEFARQRINALADLESAESKKFVDFYGEPHRARVVAWYGRAAS